MSIKGHDRVEREYHHYYSLPHLSVRVDSPPEEQSTYYC